MDEQKSTESKNKENNFMNGSQWYHEAFKISLLANVGIALIEVLRLEVQSRYETKIELEDIEGIRHQEIAIERKLC